VTPQVTAPKNSAVVERDRSLWLGVLEVSKELDLHDHSGLPPVPPPPNPWPSGLEARLAEAPPTGGIQEPR